MSGRLLRPRGRTPTRAPTLPSLPIKDLPRKRQTPRETRSAVTRQSSSGSRRTSHRISQLTASADDVDVAKGSKISNLKHIIADGPSQANDTDQYHKRQTPRETNSAVTRQSFSTSKRTTHPISQLTASADDVGVAKGSKISNLKHKIADGLSQAKDTVGPSLGGGVELSQPCKKLKKGNVLGEQLKLVDESIIRKPRWRRLAEVGAEAQHQALPSTSSGLPSDNVVEMERAPTDSDPAGSSPSEDVNVCDENEFNQRRLLVENAFVEAEDRVPLDPSPSGSSLSREGVAVQNEDTLNRSLSGRPVVEMGQVPCDPTPCRSSPSNANSYYDQEKLVESAMSSVMSCSFNNKCGEIQSCVNELGENGRKSKNQALPAGFTKDIAPEGDKLTSTGLQQSGQDMFKGGEMAMLDPSPMELPSENSVLPFTKRSGFWDLVETKEVFHLLPQQPHFRPLRQYGKEFREGMAIGLMVSFANLVTDLSRLRIADSHQQFEEKLKALDPLEENGFNIQPVRDRLKQLLELRSTLRHSEGKKQLLGEKVEELEVEKDQNAWLMFSVDEYLSELEETLTRLRERKGYVLDEITKNDYELVNLQRDVQAADEASVSAEHQFSTALTAPW